MALNFIFFVQPSIAKANKPIQSIILENFFPLKKKETETLILAAGRMRLARCVLRTSTCKPIFLLAADPLLLIGI